MSWAESSDLLSLAFDAFNRERAQLEIAAGRARIMHEQVHALCGLFWSIRCWLEREAVRACADCGDRVEWVFHRGCG